MTCCILLAESRLDVVGRSGLLLSIKPNFLSKIRDSYPESVFLSPSFPVLHDRKSWSTPWTNLVCFLISIQPDPSPVVSTIEDPLEVLLAFPKVNISPDHWNPDILSIWHVHIHTIPDKDKMFRLHKKTFARCSCFDTSARAERSDRPEVSKGKPKTKYPFLNEYKSRPGARSLLAIN